VNLAGGPADIDQPTSALAAILPAAPPAPEAFLALMRPRLERWAQILEKEGFAALREAWLSRAHGLGGPARAQIGETTVEGRMIGLSAHGELEIETAAGLRYISAGDIHFPESSPTPNKA
ncbi:MAG: biotin--[acetyl-CoA-carboxylase] ligase, partial [Hyphomonadaceae bacterium]